MSSTPITLIPATLKDAALDSPTFRGTVLHYAEQVDLAEKWLDGFIKASTKLVNEVLNLEDPVYNYLARTLPASISESVIDHDYTLLAMQRYVEGSQGFWTNIIAGARRMEKNVCEPLLAFQRGEMKTFKETRRLLEAAQTKYDSLLARYLSQSKSKEPSALREDAFQLYEARKGYIKTCFDFCIAAPVFRTELDRTLTKVFSNQWNEQMKLRKDHAGLIERCSTDIERIRSCYDSMEVNESVFRKQLIAARTELEKRTQKQYQPARELDEYSVSTVPYLTSRPPVVAAVEGEEVPSEKQGWLFMRTLTGKPTRSVWIRRWFFLKAGIFGWLVQGYRGGGVEESEKVGVLLCNIKPAFQEDRRFCFEVKTKDTTILLQTETQADLTSWLASFEQAKRAAVESSSLVASTQAFSILPPTAPAPPSEPAYVTKGHDGNSANSGAAPTEQSLLLPRRRGDDDGGDFQRSQTLAVGGTFTRGASMDTARTLLDSPAATAGLHRKAASSTNERNFSPSGLTSAGISAFIAASHNALPFQQDKATATKDSAAAMASSEVPNSSSLAPMTLSSTPAPVNLLTAATVTSGNGIHGVGEKSPGVEKGHRKTVSLDISQHGREHSASEESHEYFPGYPQSLMVQDEHFRMLFPGTKDHVVLLVFRATWSPNDTQELPGRCFVTAQNLYFYSHYMGLVCTHSTPLSAISEVKAAPERECDYLFLHMKPVEGAEEAEAGLVIVKVFLEPLRLLQKRIDLLVKNSHNKVGSENPKLTSRELLQRLVEMEKEVEDKSSDEGSWEDVGLYMDGHHDGRREAKEIKLKIDDDGKDDRSRDNRVKLPATPVEYTPPGMSRKSLERGFAVSPKVLFHVLFGEKSTVFPTLYAQRRAQPVHQVAWRELDKGRARRTFSYSTTFFDVFGRNRKADIEDHQTIELQDESLCYIVTDLKIPWHLPHGMDFVMVSKIVITYVDKAKSKLTVWTRVDWFKDPMFSKGIVERQALEDLDNDALDLGDVVAQALRKLGRSPQLHTAVNIFGGILSSPSTTTTTTTPSDIKPSLPHVQTNRIPITHRHLSHMIFENALSMAESAISNVVMALVALVKGVAGVVTAHWILILLLFGSLLGNLALSNRAGRAYWSERSANRFLKEIRAAPDGIMSRGITLVDLEEAVRPNVTTGPVEGGMCWKKFVEASQGMGAAAEKGMGARIKGGRERLAGVRHDLVVALRVVNGIERELMGAEWERFREGERRKCGLARRLLGAKEEPEERTEEEGWRELERYCRDCEGW